MKKNSYTSSTLQLIDPMTMQDGGSIDFLRFRSRFLPAFNNGKNPYSERPMRKSPPKIGTITDFGPDNFLNEKLKAFINLILQEYEN